MPVQTRARDNASANVVYKPTPPAPQQQSFPYKRRTVKKTYGRAKPARTLRQGTLTQMDFTSSAMQNFLDEEEEEEEEEEEDEKENQEPELADISKPKAKAKAKSRSHRRKTTGDVVEMGELELEEEPPRQSKRRKTLGDAPSSTASSSFHTQTLTQFLGTKSENEQEEWQINDSEEDEDALIMETPRKDQALHAHGSQDNSESAVPSLIKSSTPANREKKTDISSAQSLETPLILRNNPASVHSPLVTRSTNLDGFQPILKKSPAVRRFGRIPSDAVIPDSYSTAHDSSNAPSPASTVRATPSKKLRFDLPEDKENVTPGRTKPKSPKPKSQPSKRPPLQEIPDSDEEADFDEYGDETESEDENNDGSPDSPTPKRFRDSASSVDNAEVELADAAYDIGEETQAVFVSSARSLSQSRELSASSSAAKAASREPEASRLSESPHNEQETGDSASVQIIEETPAATPSEHADDENDAENDDSRDDVASQSQAFGTFAYTQGMESQRLPLDAIRAMGPQNHRSDIMVSLHPEHIAKIINRTKNHEFRAWKIPTEVHRVWIYITRPETQLKYMCMFGPPKSPGEIKDENGLGNREFNEGQQVAKFAYEILQVYELNNPVSLAEMKEKGWVNGPPQKYAFIPPAVVGELTGNLRCSLFDDDTQSDNQMPSSPEVNDTSESQELKAQLQSDADYNTQHYSSELADEVVPASQSPVTRRGRRTADHSPQDENFTRPALPRTRSLASQNLPPMLGARQIRPSQATTVSQLSSSPAPISPDRRAILISSQHDSGSSSVRGMRSSLRSSQYPTRSQMLPDSLINDEIAPPPPVIWDSADEDSDAVSDL
ncbi:hypothetical protein GGR57DRAFT_470084 [Xylariaceae sp. FL1272]|nr:hypothetical protein GGR57DRAFT_470084 [Xylariaceae sp. FL1272]